MGRRVVKIESEEIKKALEGVTRQYFVGNLAKPQNLEFLRDERLEMGISSYPEDTTEPAHRHSVATEYQYVVSGYTEYMDVDTGEVYGFKGGDFFAMLTGTSYLQRVKAGTNIIFIKTPSINDKELVEITEDQERWVKEKIETTFRKMRRFKQQVSEEECKRILREEKRGAFSMIGEGGYPYTIPIDFYYDEEENRIYFHGAKEGHKVDAIKNCDKVCFTTWNQGFKKEGAWEWNSTSVVAFGRARFVDEKEVVLDRLRKLATKYYPTQEEVDAEMMSSAVGRAQLFAIDIEHMTGKLVNEK